MTSGTMTLVKVHFREIQKYQHEPIGTSTDTGTSFSNPHTRPINYS